MKVGDLVELSAAGNKGNMNHRVKNRIGIIISIEMMCSHFRHASRKHPYGIFWFGNGVHPGGNVLPCSRREIKKVKKDRKK